MDIAAYAVMSNHIHLVVRLNKLAADQWSSLEVISVGLNFYWNCFVKTRPARDKYQRLNKQFLELMIANWRKRLCDLSWFMRCLNEPVARQANLEDGATGRFWEGALNHKRYWMKPPLAACMAYVELNRSEQNRRYTKTQITLQFNGGFAA